MRKVLRVLCYLPVILLGIAGVVILIHMYDITEIGRPKATVVDNADAPGKSKKPTPRGPFSNPTP
ncbi:MAG: hypothetical protein WAK31_23560 [Chthoniobacterales bacterium]